MDRVTVLDYADRIERDLRENVLPFWMHTAVDGDGAVIGSLTNDLVLDRTVDRGAVVLSRVLWVFSTAALRYPDAGYLAVADRTYQRLMYRFADLEHGGFVWSTDADGAVLRDRKQIYGQAFPLYALAAYHQAGGQPVPLETAIGLHRLLEQQARDHVHGGYIEALSRTWQPIEDMRLSAVDLNEPKSQNAHLHIMEAYAALLEVWPDEGLRTAQRDLLDLMLTTIVDPDAGHLGLFFTADWQPRSDRISYGHDIEAAWLLTGAAEAMDDPALLARVHELAVHIADVTLAEGIDSDGAVVNLGSPSGWIDTNKEWWPQAEGVTGFLNAYQISPQPQYLQAALRLWDFIETRLVDREHGEWFRGVTRDGQVLADELKVSFWKGPYHNGRMGLEAPARLRAIAETLP